MRKLVFLKTFPAQTLNGAEIANLERLSVLQSSGFDVSIHMALPKSIERTLPTFVHRMGGVWEGSSYILNGIRCFVSFDDAFHDEKLSALHPVGEYFLSLLSREKPDWVWTHYYDFFSTRAAYLYRNDRHWVDITDNEFPRPIQMKQVRELHEVYSNLKVLMVASPFMERMCRLDFPQAQIKRFDNPLHTLLSAPVSPQPEYWMMVNPVKEKGGLFFKDLTDVLPRHSFVCVLNWDPHQNPPPAFSGHVKVLERQRSLNPLWPRAKGLLVPSVWSEGFGRVAMEAMAAGVPVIGSDRGALPETLGDGGIVMPLDLEKWVDLLNKPDSYFDHFRIAGTQRVRTYLHEGQAQWESLKQELQL